MLKFSALCLTWMSRTWHCQKQRWITALQPAAAVSNHLFVLWCKINKPVVRLFVIKSGDVLLHTCAAGTRADLIKDKIKSNIVALLLVWCFEGDIAEMKACLWQHQSVSSNLPPRAWLKEETFNNLYSEFVRASASPWKPSEKWSITLCSGPLSLRLLEMKIGNHPSDQRQRPLPRAWMYDYIALTAFICIPPIQQCGLECATPPQQKNCSPENSSQAVPNPLNAINPAFTHSTSLSLYFSAFLHGEAWLIWLSRMGDRKVGGLGKVFGSIA